MLFCSIGSYKVIGFTGTSVFAVSDFFLVGVGSFLLLCLVVGIHLCCERKGVV